MHDIALSGVISALSYALDITEGQPAGHAVRSCAIGMRIAEELGLPSDTRSDLFYALLLKDAGCSANAERMAALFGADDRAAKRTSKLVDWSNPLQAVLWSWRTVAPGGSLRDRLGRMKGIKDAGEVTKQFMEARCDRGAEIARMLYLTEETAAAIRSLDEHWDGRGMPDGLRGDEIPLLARILCLAQTAEIFHAAGGVKAVRTVAKRRRGRWFDPALVDALLRVCRDAGFWRTLEDPDVSGWEPADLLLRGRRRAAGPDRRGVRPRDRREVPVHREPLRAGRRDRRRDRGPAGLRRRRRGATCAAPDCCTTSASSRSPT